MRATLIALVFVGGCSGSGRSGGGTVLPPDLSACVGLGCNVQACAADSPTTLVGTLFAPNGLDPVPNATVYVPQGQLVPFSDSVACDLCGGGGTLAGAVTSTTTRYDGGFTLPGVPVGDKIPLVIELGRFRRVVTVTVQKCQQNLVPKDPNVFGVRLPGKDGDLSPDDHVPRIAVATGDYDQIECVLGRMGLSQLDLYNDRDPGTTLPATIGELDALLNDIVKLKKYNILMINCTQAQFETSLAKPGVIKNLEDYVASGGRLYATDWAYDMINQVPGFAPFLCFVPGGVDGPSPPPMCAGTPGVPREAHSTTAWSTGAIVHDPTLLKWLSIFPGTLVNNQVAVAYNFVVVNHVGDAMSHPTTTWVDGDATDPGALPQLGKGVRPMTVTFDYKQCGRVHYSTYNTEPNATVLDTATYRFPTCNNRTTFNPQERLLEYLIFETAQCVGPIG